MSICDAGSVDGTLDSLAMVTLDATTGVYHVEIMTNIFEDGAPMGPWFTPASYIRDPNDMSIKLWVNGVLKQSSNTGRMVHGIAEQVAYLSRHVTLQPGDVIATGTPAGVGMPRGEFLRAGDEVKIEVDGCGTLVNRMIQDGY